MAITAKNNPDVYPIDLFVYKDENGISHICTEDPFETKNRNSDIDDLCETIFDFMKHTGTDKNPILVRVKCFAVKNRRRINFGPDTLARAEKTNTMHVRDEDNNIVEILKSISQNVRYPYIGVVFEAGGNNVATRNYSAHGECSDGIPQHAIHIANGPSPLPKAEGFELGNQN